MSNHYHLVLTDTEGELPDFMRDLNSLVSKALNAIRGIRGENYERRGYNAVVVGDGGRLLRHCAYTEANPCAANLVELAKHWTGVSSVSMNYGDTKTIQRPDDGLWKPSKDSKARRADSNRAMHCGRIKCPLEASVQLHRPPCLNGLGAEKTRSEVQRMVKGLEDDAKKQRSRTGQAVLGMEVVCGFGYLSSATGKEQFFDKEPEVSGNDAGVRAVLKRNLDEFVALYRLALTEFRERGRAVFPEGTWWMRRCLGQTCRAYCSSG